MSPKDVLIEGAPPQGPQGPQESQEGIITLEILRLIKDAQQQHGLRHGDYQRYRGYCTRRIRRLRKVLKLPQGDRRHFKRRDVTATQIESASKDERLLHLPLMQAERAWAHAMQLRQESNTEPRKRFHLVARLRKACTHSLYLNTLIHSSASCDARAKLEAQAYVHYIHGSLHFELQLWAEAAENYKRAQLLYDTILKTLPDEFQLVYLQKLEEITPSLRYCAYNIGDEKQINLLELRGIGDLFAQAKQKQSVDNLEIKWEGFTVIARAEKCKLFINSLKEFDETLTNTNERVSLIEQLLIDCRDAINAARDELRLNSPGAQLLLTYLLHVRLTRTIQRNLYLIEQAKKAQDIVRLYEIILQQMQEMKQLAGMENCEGYQNNCDLYIVAYKSYRCFHLAKACATTRKWRESLILYSKSSKYAKEVANSNLPADFKKKLQELQKEIESDEITAHAQCVIEDTAEAPLPATVLPTKVQKSKKPLIERLDEYREDTQLLTKNPNIVSLPPAMEPIPCKPLFFDLAFNLVKFPDVQDKLDPAANKNKASSGMSGFVKGLFGWGGKK